MIRRTDGSERVPPFVQLAGTWYLVTNWRQSDEDVRAQGPDALLLRPLGADEEQLLRERLHDTLVEAHAMIARDHHEPP